MVLPMMFHSCLMEEEDIFDKSAIERVEEYLDGYRTLLSSNETGWLLEYYAEEEQSYGGYAYILKFTTEQVTAYFQLADDCSKTVTSFYNMVGDDGPVLTFDTYNEYLHYFATPDITNYEALHGDYEFNIMGSSDDGSEVYLKGKKTGNLMTLRKFDGDPVEYLNKVNSIAAAVDFPAFEMTVDGTEASCSLAGNIFQYTIPAEDGQDAETGSSAFCYTDTGLTFYSPVEISGTVYYGLDYKDGQLVSDDGKVIISEGELALNQMFIMNDWYIAYSTLGSYGQACFDIVKSALDTEGEELQWAFLGSSLYDEFGFNFQSGPYVGFLGFDYQLQGEDTVILQFSMSGDQNGVYYHNYLGFNYALMPFGYSSANTFVITANGDGTPPASVTLTDTANPDNVITLYSERVSLPFDN